jgi:hypothetical protein
MSLGPGVLNYYCNLLYLQLDMYKSRTVDSKTLVGIIRESKGFQDIIPVLIIKKLNFNLLIIYKL